MRVFVAKFLGSCAGLGYFPFAPGTFTSLVSVVLFVLFPSLLRIEIALPVLVVIFTSGLWASSVMEEVYGHDPSQVTIDELAGQWLALLLLPGGWFTAALGFTAFRFFDILKPEPVNTAQKLPGGWGIMIDDLLAGVYANFSVRIVLWLLSFFPVAMPL